MDVTNRVMPDRTILSVELVEAEDGVVIDLRFNGEGFLYKMVRFLVGSVVRCAQGKLATSEVERLLAGVDFSEKAPRYFVLRRTA